MATKKTKKNITVKVRDLTPRKDAKGGVRPSIAPSIVPSGSH